MKIRAPLPKIQLKESRFAQVWFVFSQVVKLSWQVNPKLLVFAILVNSIVGFLIYPSLKLEKAFIDGLINNIGQDFWGPAGQGIILILFLRFLIAIFRGALNRTGFYFRRMMSRIFSAHLNSLMAKKHAELDVVMIDSPEFKDRFSKIKRESGRRAWGLMWPVVAIPASLVGVVSTLVIIFSFRPVVSLVILFLAVPVFWVDAKYIKKEYQFQTEVNPLHRVWGWLEHYLLRPRNILEIKLLKLADPFSKRIRKIQNKIFSGWINIEKKKTFWQVVASLPQHIFNFGVGIYLASLVFIQQLTVGSAEMIFRAIGSFRMNLSDLVSNFLELYENYLYVTDLVWLFSLQPSMVVSQKGRKVNPKVDLEIEFKDVWFRYTEKTPWVLKDINFKISSKANVAIVGENGAGKSTLVKLICRFYDPQKGKILLNGVDLKKYSIADLWNYYSVQFQDFEVYPFTARESIGYGDIKKLKELKLIKNAAKKAEAHEYIQSLSLKYENPLDPAFEKGVRPSYGQWQRIVLARVFLKDAPLIILDEPTSNVDPRAEEQIFEKIIQYSKEKVLVLISHRFSTVRRADKIYVLDKGKIAERGSHQELMKQDDKYAHLFNLQAKGYQ